MKNNFSLKKIIKFLFIYQTILLSINFTAMAEEQNVTLLKNKWSFEGVFGTFDRAALRRGYQVYNEVCSSCHSIELLSYRNLSENGGPEFSLEDAPEAHRQLENRSTTGKLLLIP